MAGDPLREFNTRRAVAQTIGTVASQLGATINVTPNELNARPEFVVEFTGNERKVSSAILDFMFPKEPQPAQLIHYTSLSALENIANTNELRLYPILKRIGQGELDQFAADHNFEGYTDQSSGPPLYKEFSRDLFYISLSRENAQNQGYLWNVFGDGGKGVQLHFEISVKAADLRPINYQSPKRQLLKKINNQLIASGCVPFIPWGISRIGAFYLPSSLIIEDEIRLLIKRYSDGIDDTEDDTKFEYWPIQLSQNNQFARFDLTRITCGPNCDPADVKKIISKTILAITPITPSK